MDAQSFWFSSGAAGGGGGGGGDEGFPIGNSLRWRDGVDKNLTCPTRLTGALSWTWSAWIKRSQIGNMMPIWSPISTTASSVGLRFGMNGNDNIGYQSGTGGADGFASTAFFRDPAAWYHVVCQANRTTNLCTIWINGDQVAQGATTNNMSFDNSNMRFCWANTDNNSVSDFLITDAYMLQDTQLPTAFARENDQGLWVPRETTFTAGQYGANGFHLTFAADTITNDGTNIIVADQAPIGAAGTGHEAANNFTGFGFNTDPVGVFSNQTTATPGGFRGTDPATNMFDGSLSTRALADQSNAIITFEPNPALAFTNGVHMNVNHTTASPGEFRVTVDGTTGAWTTFPNPNNSTAGLVNTVATGAGSLERIEVRRTDDQLPAVIAIGLNGTAAANILTDNTGEDFDLLTDSPTQNFATWNSVKGFGDVGQPATNVWQTNDAALTAGPGSLPNGVGDSCTPSTIGQTNRDVYVEATIVTLNNVVSFSFTDPQLQVGPDLNQPYFFMCTTGNCNIKNGGANNNGPALGVDPTGQTFGFHVDVSEGEIDIIHNGAVIATSTGWTFTDARALKVISNGDGNSKEVIINYGQKPFVTRPAALGNDTELQTQNLPTPTILDGRNHFATRTYPGSSTEDVVINDLEFSPGLVWMKSTDTESSWEMADVVRGVNQLLSSDDTGANENRADSLTDFGANGFTLGNGQSNINFGGRNYVAFSWRAGGAAAANGDGDIASQVSANRDGGFSVVRYTGSTGDDSVGHGLSQAPDFVIVKPLNAVAWICFHRSLGFSTWLNLNTDDSTTGRDVAAMWGGEANWTNTTFGVNPAGDANNNLNNQDTIAYCWHSVPGYSLMSTYQGNGQNNGTFVFCGFRPAWIMVKRVTANGNWRIYDSTRNPTNNGNMLGILPNIPNSDQSGNNVDLLSNGFKWRDDNADQNRGSLYAFVAFAECPFGGENTAPVTAR